MDIKRLGIIAVVVILIVAIGAYAFISLNTVETKIEVGVANQTAKNGDYVTIQLKDIYRKEIPNQVVDLKILDDSGWAHKFNVTTDELGRGYVQLVGFENGNYTAHASFNGTWFLTESRASTSFMISDGYENY